MIGLALCIRTIDSNIKLPNNTSLYLQPAFIPQRHSNLPGLLQFVPGITSHPADWYVNLLLSVLLHTNVTLINEVHAYDFTGTRIQMRTGLKVLLHIVLMTTTTTTVTATAAATMKPTKQ
jgi:hypothetical protein